ncbi:MAG TPA: pitrilysin family protein [Verrucomicrobiae bacterium]|nr:pitrilysin family protein [Verrucomicrobiae bacterium]
MTNQPTHLYTKKVLKNGLTLLMVPIETAASVTMTVFIKAGSRYESEDQNGISHFLEHLHFKGSRKYPNAKKLSETVDSIGGEFNAYTGKEHTQYFIRAAYEHLDLVFEVLTDMIQNPLIDEKELEREKGVIIEEINMYRDNPQIHVESIFEESLWPDTPLGRDIAGTAEVVRKISKQDVMNYRKKYYQPGNMIIAVAGQFDQKKFETMIDEHWGKLPSTHIFNYKPVNGRQNKPRVKVQTKATEQAHLIVGFKGYPFRHRNNNALRILATTLGGGMSSRLFLRVRERMGLAYYISASLNNYLDSGNFTIQAGLKVDSVTPAIDVILQELYKVRDQGITVGELKKAKEYIKGKIALALEDPHDKLEWYLGQEAFIGRIRTIKQTFEEFDAVTLDQVKKVAEDIIKEDCVNLALIGPFKDSKIFEKKLGI